MYRKEIDVVPLDVVSAIRDAVAWSCVDDVWNIWSRSAEASLLMRTVMRVVPPLAALPFWRRVCDVFLEDVLEAEPLVGELVGCIGLVKGMRLMCIVLQYFVNSSFAPVLLFRMRLKSVADVLEGMRKHGFAQSRWDALLRYWSAVCRHGPCGPVFTLHRWCEWVPPDLYGFYRCFF